MLNILSLEWLHFFPHYFEIVGQFPLAEVKVLGDEPIDGGPGCSHLTI